MADNFTAKDAGGVTTTFGSDDVGSVQYPRKKIVWGADGTVNEVSTATPFPVQAIATENHMGEVGSPVEIVDVDMSCATGALTSGDIAADTQVITNLCRVADGKCVLQSVQVLDPDVQSAALDIVFLSANQSLGTEDAAPSITDANGVNILGVVSVPPSEYSSLVQFSVATIRNIGLILQPATGTRNVYVALITRGSPTYTGGSVKLRIGVLQG